MGLNRTGTSAGLLTYKKYAPASLATYSTSSATEADLDATNLKLPDFTVPPSGAVLVVLSAQAVAGADGGAYSWSLRDGSGNIAGTKTFVTAASTQSGRGTARIIVTGLTPGATITGWKWAHARPAGTGTANTYMDDGTIGANDAGAGIMEVYALPL